MHEPAAFLTIGIIVATCLFSFRGFRNRAFEAKHIFCPEYILADKEYYRLVTSGFLHSGVPHLLFNMLSFYCFAQSIELVYGASNLLIIYFGAIIGGSLLSLYIHRHHDYLAYGASGGVCGVIFASIFLFPGMKIGFFMLPIGIPTWVYAPLFLVGSFYAMRAGKDNVGHDAHLGGAIVGLALAAVLHPGIITRSPWLFTVVSLLIVALFWWMVRKPLHLVVEPSARSFREERPGPLKIFSRERKKGFNTDDLLEKISREGLHNLTEEERAHLNAVSEKFRRRAEAKKPDSELYF